MRLRRPQRALRRASIDFLVFIPATLETRPTECSRPSNERAPPLRRSTARLSTSPLRVYRYPYIKERGLLCAGCTAPSGVGACGNGPADERISCRHVGALTKQYDQVRLPSVNIARQHSARSFSSILPERFHPIPTPLGRIVTAREV